MARRDNGARRQRLAASARHNNAPGPNKRPDNIWRARGRESRRPAYKLALSKAGERRPAALFLAPGRPAGRRDNGARPHGLRVQTRACRLLAGARHQTDNQAARRKLCKFARARQLFGQSSTLLGLYRAAPSQRHRRRQRQPAAPEAGARGARASPALTFAPGKYWPCGWRPAIMIQFGRRPAGRARTRPK